MPMGVVATGSVENRGDATISPFAFVAVGTGDVNGIHGEAGPLPVGSAIAVSGGSGAVTVQGTLSKAIGAMSVAGTGSVAIQATAAITLGEYGNAYPEGGLQF